MRRAACDAAAGDKNGSRSTRTGQGWTSGWVWGLGGLEGEGAAGRQLSELKQVYELVRLSSAAQLWRGKKTMAWQREVYAFRGAVAVGWLDGWTAWLAGWLAGWLAAV